MTNPWLCAGCGKPSKGHERCCDCITDVLYRDNGECLEQAIKVEPEGSQMELKQKIAKAICKSRKFECGQGCCAPICMESLGVARDKCSRCLQVHKDLVEAIVGVL